jgi:endonuclease-3
MYLLPRREWIDYSHRVIHHGRQVCKARRPLCPRCPLRRFCPRVGVPD